MDRLAMIPQNKGVVGGYVLLNEWFHRPYGEKNKRIGLMLRRIVNELFNRHTLIGVPVMPALIYPILLRKSARSQRPLSPPHPNRLHYATFQTHPANTVAAA